MKKCIFLLVSIVCLNLGLNVYAETATLTSYYPAPRGAYVAMNVVPKEPLPTCEELIEYELRTDLDGRLVRCEQDPVDTTYKWINISVWHQKEKTVYIYDMKDDLGVNISANMRVGIGTNSPLGMLHLAGNSSIIAEGLFDGNVPIPELSYGDTLFLWHPQRSAFRAGTYEEGTIESSNIGIYSFSFGNNNLIQAEHSSILGGQSNEITTDPGGTILGSHNVIAGGQANTIEDGFHNVISGGSGNTIDDNQSEPDPIVHHNTIGGGKNNTISDDDSYPSLANTIAGGESNKTEYPWTTVGGGKENQAIMTYSTVGGGQMNTASGSDPDPTKAGHATVAGGKKNTASGDYATITGGNENTALDEYSFIGGGNKNLAKGLASVVGGGSENTADGEIGISGGYVTVGGGLQNTTTEATYSVIAGGWANKIERNLASTDIDIASTIGGGYNNDIRGALSTIAGGEQNVIQGKVPASASLTSGATIAGGSNNSILVYNLTGVKFLPDHATIGGGILNIAKHNHTTIAGGKNNQAFSYGSTIGGGDSNIAGENNNNAGPPWPAEYATVSGGANNSATESYSTVAGGDGNTAQGEYSFAVGNANIAKGDYSTAIGNHVTSHSYGSFVTGRYNSQPVGYYSEDIWQKNDPLFVIGNGDSGAPQNAVTVLKNGNVGIGVAFPTQTLHIKDVMRLQPQTNPPSSCDINGNGMLYVDSSRALCFCDGQGWRNIAPYGSCD